MSTNRIVRIVIGLALIIYGVYAHNWWFALGLLPLLTGVLNWCPLEMKMGTCDPASGCCASTPARTSSRNSACCTPQTPSQKPSDVSGWIPAQSSEKPSGASDSVRIEILGTGCKRCAQLEQAVKEAVSTREGKFDVVKVEDPQTIAAYRVMQTPGLVIDGKVVSTGRVLSPEEIRKLLTENQHKGEKV